MQRNSHPPCNCTTLLHVTFNSHLPKLKEFTTLIQHIDTESAAAYLKPPPTIFHNLSPPPTISYNFLLYPPGISYISYKTCRPVLIYYIPTTMSSCQSNPDTTEPKHNLMQEFELIPQGIPALYAHSERYAKENSLAKASMDGFVNFSRRYRGRLLHIRSLPRACV